VSATPSEPAAEAAWTPTFPLIRRIDRYWYTAEKYVCGGLFLLMAMLVFGSVVQGAFVVRREWSDVVILFAVCLLGARTRAVKPGETAPGWGRVVIHAALATGLIVGLVFGAIRVLEGRSVEIQKLALVMMIWVALIGASMATYERSHLALEMGEKLWPEKVLHLVKALAHGVTSAFCMAAFLLSVRLLEHQQQLGQAIIGVEWLERWQAFVIVPYAFAAMALRFFAQAACIATNKAEPMEDRLPT
jgi:TRAP-type C4-dicarboxylate transport system permease small subunit